MKFGSRSSPDKVYQQLESVTEPGSRRSPGGAFLQLKSKAKFGSRRSPDEAYQQLKLKLVTESGSRGSPGGVLLRGGRWGKSPPLSPLFFFFFLWSLNDRTFN